MNRQVYVGKGTGLFAQDALQELRIIDLWEVEQRRGEADLLKRILRKMPC
jgi:hypothetical protein